MTIAVAIKCNDGLVLGADTLMAHGKPSEAGSFAHYETKTHGTDGRYFSASMVGAGDSYHYRSLALSVMQKLNAGESEDVERLPDTRSILEAALTELASGINSMPDIVTLVGSVKPLHKQIDLFKTHDLVVDTALPIEVIGIGEESLVRYIKERLYRPNLSLRKAAALAVYIILVAKEYCPQYCGGPTDIEILRTEYPLRVSPSRQKIEELEGAFEKGGKRHLRALLEEASQLLGEPT
jgi:hypothetical protein